MRGPSKAACKKGGKKAAKSPKSPVGRSKAKGKKR